MNLFTLLLARMERKKNEIRFVKEGIDAFANAAFTFFVEFYR